MGSRLLEVFGPGSQIALGDDYPVLQHRGCEGNGIASARLADRHLVDGRSTVLADQTRLGAVEANRTADLAGVEQYRHLVVRLAIEEEAHRRAVYLAHVTRQ